MPRAKVEVMRLLVSLVVVMTAMTGCTSEHGDAMREPSPIPGASFHVISAHVVPCDRDHPELHGCMYVRVANVGTQTGDGACVLTVPSDRFVLPNGRRHDQVQLTEVAPHKAVNLLAVGTFRGTNETWRVTCSPGEQIVPPPDASGG